MGSAPLAGALVLALMTRPTIIIAVRAALKSVPPSIREAVACEEQAMRWASAKVAPFRSCQNKIMAVRKIGEK